MATVSKPNQEAEISEIEKILKEKFHFSKEIHTEIISEDLRKIDISLDYNILVITGANESDTKAVYDLKLNGEFDKYKIKRVYYKSRMIQD